MKENAKIAGRHYDFKPVREAIELIERVVEREAIPRKAAYMIGNALKYLLRAGAKPGESWEDDVRKAENYLHRAHAGKWIADKREK